MSNKKDDLIRANVSENTSTVIQKTRCYMEPASGWPKKGSYQKSQENKNDEWKEIEIRGWPHAGFTLTFDTETFPFDHGQRALYGFYQLRGVIGERRRKLHRQIKDDAAFRKALDAPYEIGVFYNDAPGFVSNGQLEALKEFVHTFNAEVRAGKRIDPVTGLPFPRLNKPITQQQFIRRVLYHYAGQLGDDLLINGLNLGFDLGALSHYSGIARSKGWFGAFKMRLNDYRPKPGKEGKKATARDYFYPAVYFQPLGMKRNKFGWALESEKSDEAASIAHGRKVKKAKTKKAKALKAKFLDVSQLGLAMLGTGHSSMEALAKTLKTTTQKGDFDAYDDPFTAEAFDYCFGDVQTTFEIWEKLRDRYRTLGISKPVSEVYSAASLGKGFYDDLGVPRFMDAHPGFPPSVLGCCMEAFYGGLTDVRIRNRAVEVIHTDFKSQYSTANVLLGLQDLLLAKSFAIRCGQVPHWIEQVIYVADRGKQHLHTRQQFDWLKTQAAYFAGDGRCQALRELLNTDFDRVAVGEWVTAFGPWIWPELAKAARAAKAACEETPAAHLDDVRDFLESISLDDLRCRETWRNPLMKTFVLIKPNGDLLPVHAAYGGASSNLAKNQAKSGAAAWYAIPDAISSKIKTGRTPHILDAITIVPIGRVKTTPKFSINLDEEDFATAIINRRIAIEARMEELLGEPERDAHDAEQLGLKIVASATAFGIHAQVDVDGRTGDYSSYTDEELLEALMSGGALTEAECAKAAKKRQKKEGFEVNLYTGDPTPKQVRVPHLEKPGPHFAPHLASLITASGRLMLAICERLAADRGIGYAMCDTDSMAFARPDWMKRNDFRKRVDEIVNWFTPLYPYSPKTDKDGKPFSILQYEKANWQPGGKKGEYEPLYFLGLAAKRYALFHRVPFQEVMDEATELERAHCAAFIRNCLGGREPDHYPLFRKISAHGTGGLEQPGDYEHIMPKPAKELAWRVRNKRKKFVGKLLAANALCEEMLRDVWRKFVLANEAGKKLQLVGEAFGQPVIVSVSLRSKGYWEDFKNLPEKRPCMFFSTLPKPVIAVEDRNGAYKDIVEGADVVAYGPSKKTFKDLEPHLLSPKDHQPHSLAEINAELAKLDLKAGTGAKSYVRFRTFRDFFVGTGFLEGRKRGYFDKQEFTSDPPDGTGLLKRKVLVIAAKMAIGKEGNELRDDLAVEVAGVKSGLDTQAFEETLKFNPSIFDEMQLAELAARTCIAANHLGEYASGSRPPSIETVKKVVRALQDRERGVPVEDEKLLRKQRQDRLRADIRSLSKRFDACSQAQHRQAIEWGKAVGLDLRRKSPGLARLIWRLGASSKQPKEIAARLTHFMRGKDIEGREEKAIALLVKREC
jgi:transcriptional regulator with XRE-family HTH domain